jgi:hypothetical protein
VQSLVTVSELNDKNQRVDLYFLKLDIDFVGIFAMIRQSLATRSSEEDNKLSILKQLF